MEEWIEEFLYRGRPPSGPDSDKDTAFHVVIGQQVDNPFGDGTKQRRTVGPMSLEAAEQAGWTLAEIIDAINVEAVKGLSAAQTKITELEAEVASLKAA